MNVVTSYPLVDEILEQHKSVINADFDGYRNHVTRMLNFCHYLRPEITEEESKKLQIAGAFHDIALWTHDRVDYLVPSYQDCHRYLAETGLADWNGEIQIIIDMHHLITRYTGPYETLAELFRKADLVDFSFGVVKHGVDPDFINDVKMALPNAGFHKTLLRFTGKQLTRNPFNPAPMMRIKNIYNK